MCSAAAFFLGHAAIPLARLDLEPRELLLQLGDDVGNRLAQGLDAIEAAVLEQAAPVIDRVGMDRRAPEPANARHGRDQVRAKASFDLHLAAFFDGAEALFFFGLVALGFRASLVERICPLAIVIPFRPNSPSFLLQDRSRSSAEIRLQPFQQARARRPCRCASFKGGAHVIVSRFRRPEAVGLRQRPAPFGGVLRPAAGRVHFPARLAAAIASRPSSEAAFSAR